MVEAERWMVAAGFCLLGTALFLAGRELALWFTERHMRHMRRMRK